MEAKREEGHRTTHISWIPSKTLRFACFCLSHPGVFQPSFLFGNQDPFQTSNRRWYHQEEVHQPLKVEFNPKESHLRNYRAFVFGLMFTIGFP